MNVISLQSGSNGNCIYIESGDASLLIDAGLSGTQVQRRLAAHGRDVRRVGAVLISHDHADHTSCLGVLQRKFGLPACASRKTLGALHGNEKLGSLGETQAFRAGDTLRLGPLTVETLPTPHDAVDGVAIIVDDGECRMGIFTDLGHAFDGLEPAIASLDAVLLESNYDPVMLGRSRYPRWLQQRIAGPGGHLSNREAAELLATASDRLQWACLGHLSDDSNTARQALATHREVLGSSPTLHVAGRYEATAVLSIEARRSPAESSDRQLSLFRC
jgi:phosphoribosyl 1,2-cyclic phosphodiesterase